MEEVLAFSTVLMPFVVALVELVKRTANLPKNLLPLLALFIGALIGVVSYPFTDFDLVLRLWAGAIAGLGATGLFEVFNKREGYTKDITED